MYKRQPLRICVINVVSLSASGPFTQTVTSSFCRYSTTSLETVSYTHLYHFSSITDVQIRGYIGGDLIGFSYAPKVSATIDGNLRFAATALEVTGDVARSITVACGEATLAASSKSVYFIGDSLYFSGSTGDLTAEALEVSLSGRVDGDVNVQADRVTFLNGFSCTGSIREMCIRDRR